MQRVRQLSDPLPGHLQTLEDIAFRTQYDNNAHVYSVVGINEGHRAIAQPEVLASYMRDTIDSKLARYVTSKKQRKLPRDAKIPRRWNPCEHESYRGYYQYIPINGLLHGPTVDACSKNISVPIDGSPGSSVYVRTCYEICNLAKDNLVRNEIRPANIETVNGLFAHSALPKKIKIDRDPFDTDFSVWFLLVDMVDLALGVKSIAKSLAGVPRSIYKGSSETARDIANKHLGFRFGVVPTIRDIQEFIVQLKHWHDKYDNARAILSARHRRHQPKTDLSMIFPSWKERVYFNWPRTGSIPIVVSCLIRSDTVATWHGNTLYGFQCPEFSGWLARVYQFIDSWGILDPSAVWDVIPFSFVLDWFFTTSSWLHRFKPKLFPAAAVIYDYAESISVKTQISYTLTAQSLPGNIFNVPGVAWQPSINAQSYTAFIGSETYSTYCRHRFKPDVGSISLVSGLKFKNRRKAAVDLNRAAVAASLVAQRLPR